jgi:hypothetical protein
MRAPTHLFVVTALLEIGAGMALLVAPAMIITLVFGPSEMQPAAPMGRLAGAALLALGAACWWARHDGDSLASRALMSGLLIYNVAIVGLVFSGSLGSISPLLWALVVVHGSMALWCVWSLRVAPVRVSV